MTLLSSTIPNLFVPNWTTITGNTNASTGSFLLVDTTANAITVTLPSAPVLNNVVNFSDPTQSWTAKNLTVVAPNNGLIAGSATPLVADVAGISFYLFYIGGTVGWKFFHGASSLPGPIGPGGNTTISGATVSGDIPVFNTTTGQLVDSGVSPTALNTSLNNLATNAAFNFCAGIAF